jgi:hypothetical protein
VGFFSRINEWFKRKQISANESNNSQDLQRLESQRDNISEPKPSDIAEQESEVPQPEKGMKITNWGGNWLEWLLIFLAVTFFCAGILDIGSPTRLPGNESEVFQMLDWTLVNSIKQFHAFPLWNIYIQTGLPYIADPMLHVYNPVVTAPVLLFGVHAGFKIGVYLSFLIAAFGMWKLAQVLGLGRFVRIWMAMMFAFAGQPVARFFQGQYLFIFGFAYIPWIIFSLILIAQRKRKRDIAVAAGSIALLFFSGNAYYSFFILLIIGLFGLVMLIRMRNKAPFISLDVRRTLTYLGIGALAIGVISIQLLPTAEFWPRLSKDLNLAGAQSVKQIILDYTSKDSQRPDAYSILPAREEFYAYIGLTPFLALAMLPLAIWKRDRRLLLFFILILLLTVGWINLEWLPWKQAFLNTRLTLQFRHLLRILVFGSFAIICLAGIGLDTLWKIFESTLHKGETVQPKGMRWLAYIGLLILGAFMIFGVVDLYNTNQFAVHSQEMYKPGYDVMVWVRENDLGEYYVRNNPNNAWQDAVLSNNLRYLDSWYHFADIRSLDGKINERLVQATPNYLTQSSMEQIPAEAELISAVDDYNILSLPESLPMMFMVDNGELKQGGEAGPLVRSQVTSLTPFFSSSNNVETIAEGLPNQTLVLLMTKYPGWKILVDGKTQPLKNVGGYLAVDVQPGIHKYKFIYSPSLFYIGLAISFIASLVLLGLFISDIRIDLQTIKERWLAFLAWIRQTRQRPAAWMRKRKPQSYEAVYRDGAILPALPLELEENSNVNVTIETQIGVSRGRAAWERWWWATIEMLQIFFRSLSLGTLLFWAGLAVYLLTRFIGLSQFPISFLGDEAAQTLYAETLINNRFHDPVTGLYLPIYVEAAGNRWTPLLSMYIHAATLTLFGKSVLVTRGTSIAIGLLVAIAVGFILKNIFKARLWWVGVLLVAITPAWFLHSRTAYETVMTTAFFAMFLWFYLKYREQGSSIVPALIFGALTFYTYSNAQIIVLGMAILLFLSDIRYHWQQRKALRKAIPVAILLALPFILFTIKKPAALSTHLHAVDSYWFHSIPFVEKALTFLKNYAYGLSPAYWFFPNGVDLPRHRMLNIAHLPISMLIFMVIGIILCLWRFRTPRYRTIILVGLAVPLGASLVQIGITRELAFIVPACLLMALGIDWVWEQIYSRIHRPLPDWIVAIPIFIILTIMSFGLLNNALVNGPLWFDDYGLYGMQYGAVQIFEETIPQYWQENPDLHFRISSTWANGTERYMSYFLTKEEQQRVDLIGVDGLLNKKYDIDPNDIFVLTPSEYDKAVQSEKLKSVEVEKIIPYPNGNPGFYFVRVAYADNIDQMIEAEAAERRILKEEVISLNGQPVTIQHSWLDMGVPEQIFDNDPFTWIRGMEANPFILEITFPQPRSIEEITLNLGAMDTDLTVDLYEQEGESPIHYQQSYRQVQEGDILKLKFPDGPHNVYKMHMEILSPYAGEVANVHIRELQLLP